MRASFELGLRRLGELSPPPTTVLLAPADSPGLSAALVGRVVAAARAEPSALVIPAVGDRRGHPIALPWAVALTVPELPDGVGVNTLVARLDDRVVLLACDDPGAVDDLDTPDDYRKWAGRG
jgi:CTP:molybdopterin cytidylyltransferase MocA